MYQGFVSEVGQVTVRARLNLRRGMPFRSAPLQGRAEPGAILNVQGVGRGEPVQGNDIWYCGPDDVYFWSGGCVSAHAVPPATSGGQAGFGDAALAVRRRPDGTIKPLDDAGLPMVFGSFPYAEGVGGRIRIDAQWVSSNIVRIEVPALAETGYGKIDVHTKAADSFRKVFAAVQEAGLAAQILTCAGTFVPRHKGWNPARGLSSHSWGVAIDLNAEWNGYGKTPTPRGEHGSLVDLVPIFEAHGFAWGGYFGAPYEDGMHFELARTDL